MAQKLIQGIGHVFYPESCPIENVENFILCTYNCCISPLHDKDRTSDGKLKKPHYHILFVGKLSDKDKRFISKITCMQYFENLYDIKASYYYLYHWTMKTNWFIPNKAHYWSADIKKGDNFELDLNNNNDNSDVYSLLLYDNLANAYDFISFFNYIRKLEDIDFFNYCLSKNSFINNYYNNLSKRVSQRLTSEVSTIKQCRAREIDEYFTDDRKLRNYSYEVDDFEQITLGFKQM